MTHLNNLSKLSKSELLTLWENIAKKQQPPTGIKTLIRELAYRLQELEYGKLDKNTTVSLKRQMMSFSKALQNGERHSSPATPLQTILEIGAIIKKQWQGELCIIKVLGKRCFEYKQQRFKSLSAVAKAITGQHISGPLFFGLKK